MKNLNNILVPIDFSEVAKNALQYAIEVARHTNTKLIVFHAFHVPSISSLPDQVEDRKKEARKRVEEKMNGLLKQYGAEDLETEKVMVLGLAGDELKEVIQNRMVDLVIMGTHGASGVKGKLLGSITADIMIDADAPVLAIPAKAKFQKIQNIAFAYDYGEIEDYKELDRLVEFARRFDAKIHVLKVAEGEYVPNFDEATEVVKFEHHLEPVKHTYELKQNEDVVKGIENYVEEENIDVLAMMPRKHNIFDRLFKGSTTRKIVKSTAVPVFGFHGT